MSQSGEYILLYGKVCIWGQSEYQRPIGTVIHRQSWVTGDHSDLSKDDLVLRKVIGNSISMFACGRTGQTLAPSLPLYRPCQPTML